MGHVPKFYTFFFLSSSLKESFLQGSPLHQTELHGDKQGETEEINASNELGSEKPCGLVLQNCDHNDTSDMVRDDLDTGKEKLVETVADIPETKDDVHVFA